jgi:hypothetical protein
MGYNPYKCIICGIVEDNGWGYGMPYYERICIMKNRGVAFKYLESDILYDGGYIITWDVCDCCFRKGQSFKEDFFSVKRTKQERIEYWKITIKKNKN